MRHTRTPKRAAAGLTIAERLGFGIDALVGLLSPKAGLERMVARTGLRQATLARAAQYAAATNPASSANWAPGHTNVNDVIEASAAPVRQRVQQLVRDFPYFTRAANCMVKLTVGQGTQFQSGVRTPDGKRDRATGQQIEDAWRWFCDEADFAGKLDFAGIEQLWKLQDAECGEHLGILRRSTDRNRYLPLAIDVREPTWLSDHQVTAGPGRGQRQGIEYATDSGRVLAYHFLDPESMVTSIPTSVPADLVIHGFDVRRPGQLRGISPFAPAVLLAHDLQDIFEAEIDATKMASKWLAFITTADPTKFQAMRTALDETGRTTEELQNAIVEYLLPGEKVDFQSPTRPNSQLEPFAQFVLRTVSITVDIAYELLSGDYRGINFSTLRGIRNDTIQQLRPTQQRHVRTAVKPVFRAFMDQAVLTGRLHLPGYWTNPRHYQRGTWTSPGFESVDPLKDAQANLLNIAGLLGSPQEVAARRGRSAEDIVDEIEDFYAMIAERDIDTTKLAETLMAAISILPKPEDTSDEDDADEPAA